MIPFCIQVLQGRVPEQNERRITKPVALILLAHYVADIHQPLHVGAECFDQQGRVVDPNEDPSALGDEGGNTFALELGDEPPRKRGIHRRKLHVGLRLTLEIDAGVIVIKAEWDVARKRGGAHSR